MANKNAKALYGAIPKCYTSCFDISVANTGCPTDDYDCWCYKHNHQTIVDTLEECLINQKNRTGKQCTKDDQFDYEQSYWKICEQYWESYGTATEPKSYPTTPATSSEISSTTTKVSTTAEPTTTSSPETAAAESSWTTSAEPTETGDSELAEASGLAEPTAAPESSGLSAGGKAGVGVGVALGLLLIGAAIFLWLRERRKRRNIEDRLRVVEEEKANTPYGGGYSNNVMYEMEGDRPHAEELRGSMGTPEMCAATTVKSGSITEYDPTSPMDHDKDSTYSGRSQSWPISPDSPNRESRVLGEIPLGSEPKPTTFG
ncbi:hypothetical protein FGRMN_4873 [Fusarium graminum]|nr:hypothetical protein FGRMN_4873 [Fusarium graminum]